MAKPIPGKYHDYFSHHHLTFDQDAGQEDFRVTVNRIFARNGVAFEMLPNGRIERLLPPVLGEELKRTLFNTGDRTLDNMLDECRAKFSDRNPLVRREALERLWDAWERLKSLADRAATMYSLIGTAKLNGIEPEAYLRDVLTRIADHPVNQIEALLPWNIASSKLHEA